MSNILDQITQAAHAKVTVTIAYTDSKHKTSYRECEPYEIKGDGVYMYDVDSDGIRLFKFSGITSVSINATKFNPRFPIKI